MPEPDESRMAAYEAAMNQLPILSREVFLLNRLDNLSFVQIAGRLMIDPVAVEACFAEAIGMICATLDGRTPRRWRPAQIEPAERGLRQRHRRYCEQALSRLGMADTMAWDDSSDDDETVKRAIVTAMPARVRQAFVLHQVEGLAYADIAGRQRTFRWMVRLRMLRAIRLIARGPMAFEDWLRQPPP
ncbi:sigma factor-like helix-turn-helix DNA-binding protein [Sphingobium lactosutens]|uniref:sigma factor-like helix-turn-helix DNA-binding protein n=1 Tax=Sphingobium lactosutens TaxID=522773 RepID=UPI0015BD2AF2|nr:sigma factor-like helix-turn-helix DNA-binding protein [Sphingobium lactosutens]